MDTDFDRIIDFIKKFKVAIVIALSVLTIIGLTIFASFSVKTVTSVKEAPFHFTKWHDQLPDNHWLKQNNSYWAELKLLQMKSTYELSGNLTMNYTKEAASQKLDSLSGFVLNIVEKQQNNKENKMFLMTKENSNVKIINLNVSETRTYTFGTTEIIVPFDVSEKEFISGKFPIISYVDNPEIATIYNGRITGITSGKTNLIICFGGQQYTYQIKVK